MGDKRVTFNNEIDFENLKHKYRHKRRGRIIFRNRGVFIEIEFQVKRFLGWRKKHSYLCSLNNHHKMNHHLRTIFKTKEYRVQTKFIDLTREGITKTGKLKTYDK